MIPFLRRGASAMLFTAAVLPLLGGCATANPAPQVSPTPPTSGETAEPGAAEVPVRTFAEWRGGFRSRALGQGIGPIVFDRALAGIRPDDEVLRLDAHQPEFSRAIWDYLDTAVSDTRIANGRSKLSGLGGLPDEIERKHGVEKGVFSAIWGIESAYGGNMGSMSVVRSLATLAWEGRRRDWAEEQLVAALRIIQDGHVTPERMIGSWAGAMGHTQFIPTSFRAYAVDHTGDGKRDVWSSNPADALASAAAYLAHFGWKRGDPIMVEVDLPSGFDFGLADGRRESSSFWSARGIRPVGGGSMRPGDAVEIIVPAGAKGPAFAAYPNFRVIKRYNNATSYAMAVTLLAQNLDPRLGPGRIAAAWPRTDKPLSRAEKIELQERLTTLGYDTDGADGIIGPNSRKAIRAFQKAQGLVPDGYVSAALLNRVRSAGS